MRKPLLLKTFFKKESITGVFFMWLNRLNSKLQLDKSASFWRASSDCQHTASSFGFCCFTIPISAANMRQRARKRVVYKKSYSFIDSMRSSCLLASRSSADLCGLKVCVCGTFDQTSRRYLPGCSSLISSSNSAGILNGLARPERGQRDEVMNRRSVT